MTTGADIVGGRLLLRDPLIVPSDRLKLGKLPDGVTLPALLVRVISVTDWQPLKRASVTRSIARVSVTVRAATYREQVAVIGLVRTHLSGWTGAFGDASRISILTAGTGPDLLGPGDSFEQAQDFRVSFDTPT